MESPRRRHDDGHGAPNARESCCARTTCDGIVAARIGRGTGPSGLCEPANLHHVVPGSMDLEHRDDPRDDSRGSARSSRDGQFLRRRSSPACNLHVPLADFAERKPSRTMRSSLAQGLLIPSRCPKGMPPATSALTAVGARTGSRLPILFHVGGGQLLRPTISRTDFHRCRTFTVATATSDRSTTWLFESSRRLAALIFDRCSIAFRGQIRVIEQGASWLPGWMRSLDWRTLLSERRAAAEDVR